MLSAEILSATIERLPMLSFFSAGRACKVLRLPFLSGRQTYLASFPPFAVIFKIYGGKTVFFHNITSNERYHTKVVSYVRKAFRGISGGFLIFENNKGIWFTHPLTGMTLEFTKPPPISSGPCDRIILVKLCPDNDYVVVVLHKGSKSLGVCHLSTRNYWAMFSSFWEDEAKHIIDLVASEDRVLALTRMGSIATMVYSNSSLEFETSMLKQRRFKDNSKLVISVEDELMVVEFDEFPHGRFKIFHADAGLRAWVLVRNLGNQALFIDDTAVRWCDPRCWRGLTNHLYYFGSYQFAWSVTPLGDSVYTSLPFPRQVTTFATLNSIVRGWYFPHLAFSETRICNNVQL